MFTFKQFITEGGAKISLKHIGGDSKGNNPFNYEELKTLLHPGKVDYSSATEKTDGSAVEIGHHPEKGFYFRYSGSGSEYPNYPEKHLQRAKNREKEPRGAAVTPERKNFINQIAETHRILSQNEPLKQMLEARSKALAKDEKNKETVSKIASIKGEIFVKSLAHASETQPGHIRWHGTSYRPDITGNVAGFVVHSELPENHWLKDRVKNIGEFSNKDIKFDHDIIHHNVPDLDVSDLKKRLEGVDPSKVKGEHKEEFENIRTEAAARIKAHWRNHAPKAPKWGKETEGHVIHPPESNFEAPRFKLTSAQQEAKMKAQMNV